MSKMASSSTQSSCQFGDEEKRALEVLFDAFGEICSLEDIAAAYSMSKADIILAGDLLCKSQDTRTQVSSCDQTSNTQTTTEEEIQTQFIGTSTETNSRISKSRKPTASLGTVSNVLGSSYATRRPFPSRVEMLEKSKPPKIEVPKSVLDSNFESSNNSEPKNDFSSNREIEQFLFSMLGDGFKLSMGVIKEVLGSCGYDIKKSMDELLEFSTARSLEKGKAIDDWTAESSGSYKEENTAISVQNQPNPNPLNSNRNRISGKKEQDKAGLSREVLNSLFGVPERVEEEPFKPRYELGINRNRYAFTRPVTRPLIDDIKIPLPAHMVLKAQLADLDDLGEDEEYKVCREVTKQHWASMKEYYEAAIAAFTEGKHKDADYLLAQGKHYFQLAREFEEKSASSLADSRKKDGDQEFSLDLSVHESRDALYLLRVHLCNLANIPTFQYLRVIVEPANEDAKKMKIRKKVIRLLEKESVNWTQDESDPESILIRLDKIDGSKLSFANRYKEK